MTIPKQVERIKALDSKRTQGDWHISAVHVCAGHLGIVESAHEYDVSTDQVSDDLFFIASAPEMAALISTLHDKLVAAEKDAEGKSIDVNITVDGETILTTSTPPLRVGDSLSLEIGGYLRGLGIKESNRE